MLDKQIIGTETEYSSFDSSTNIEEAGLILSKISQIYRGYLPNGGRMYVDIGNHLEYGTPECLDPLEATVYHHAGDVIVWNAAQKARTTIDVYRTNEAPNFDPNKPWATFGCHENYLINICHRPAIYASLIPFLVSRIILTGSGSLESGLFKISQRARFVEKVIGHETVRSRPIINTREERSLDSAEYERLHLIIGDTNVSPWATWLKLGSTALVIALIEHGVNFEHLGFSNPVEEMHRLNQSVTNNLDFIGDGYWQRALQIQEEYLVCAVRYGLKGLLPDWYKSITDFWNVGLDAIGTNWYQMIGLLDWPTKYYILEQAHSQGNDYDSAEMDWMARQYHHIDPEQSLYEAVRRDRRIELPFSQSDLTIASNSPSRHPGAQQRAEAVCDGVASKIDWNKICLNKKSYRLPL